MADGKNWTPNETQKDFLKVLEQYPDGTTLKDIELDTGIIISIIVMLRKEWENRPFLTPFQYNVRNEGITL